MKSITQISKETGIETGIISHLIRSNKFQKAKYDGKNWVDSETENKIHNILYFTCKIEYVILESKINKLCQN